MEKFLILPLIAVPPKKCDQLPILPDYDRNEKAGKDY